MQLNLGTNIRQLRRRDGRTQEALAEALGVTSQAVSRWESGGSYPDMNLLPSIANYFGVSIDALFGYSAERSLKIDMLVSRVLDMNRMNNGVDCNIDQCIALARDAMLEFPGNEKIMLCLASVLYNAGYVRCGEYHLTDPEGYDIYDTARHRTCAEWQEAITLYEKLLKTLEDGEPRHQVVRELTQLYRNIGEPEKALAVAETAPDIYGTKEFLRANAYDGKKHAQACGAALLKSVRACAELMIAGALAGGQNLSPSEKARSVRGAIELFDLVCTDGNYCEYGPFLARMYTFLSLYLWLERKHDEAFAALDQSLRLFKRFLEIRAKDNAAYTAPLVRLVSIEIPQTRPDDPVTAAASLAEDWPWWNVPEADAVRREMQADPRWDAWTAKTRT